MIQVPLSAIPSQSLSIRLGGQPCQISLRTNGSSLYFTLLVNNVSIIKYRLCQNRQRLLIDSKYKGFIGDFMFVDQSPADEPPQYSGLNSRWILYYLSDDE
jgi:hypothetical protein